MTPRRSSSRPIGATQDPTSPPTRCQLVEADFSKADLSLVDLRGSELALAGSVLGLRGAIIDPLQLLELARPFAQELGVTVEDA